MNLKPELTLALLVETAQQFCRQIHNYADLFGVTDGKAVGTFVEHQFRDILEANFSVMRGNSAKGLDLPPVETDIKVTSRRQPQSSCPFHSARQKVYGLGYNLLLMVYEKSDDHAARLSNLDFVSCVLIERERTADFTLTRILLETLAAQGNRDDIFAILSDRQLPGDEIQLTHLADEILQNPPTQGYLTISNALQWRLPYERVVKMTEVVEGITRIV